MLYKIYEFKIDARNPKPSKKYKPRGRWGGDREIEREKNPWLKFLHLSLSDRKMRIYQKSKQIAVPYIYHTNTQAHPNRKQAWHMHAIFYLRASVWMHDE